MAPFPASKTWLCSPNDLRVLSRFSRVRLFAPPWTVDRQAPLSMRFSRQNTGLGCHALLRGIFLTHRSNPCLLLCRQTFTTRATWGACQLTVRIPLHFVVFVRFLYTSRFYLNAFYVLWFFPQTLHSFCN